MVRTPDKLLRRDRIEIVISEMIDRKKTLQSWNDGTRAAVTRCLDGSLISVNNSNRVGIIAPLPLEVIIALASVRTVRTYVRTCALSKYVIR